MFKCNGFAVRKCDNVIGTWRVSSCAAGQFTLVDGGEGGGLRMWGGFRRRWRGWDCRRGRPGWVSEILWGARPGGARRRDRPGKPPIAGSGPSFGAPCYTASSCAFASSALSPVREVVREVVMVRGEGGVEEDKVLLVY